MRRWHNEKELLERRMKLDIAKHNGGYNPLGENRADDCGCALGTFRKKRPYDSCSPGTYCPICPKHRQEKKFVRRRIRRQMNRITEVGEYPRMQLWY